MTNPNQLPNSNRPIQWVVVRAVTFFALWLLIDSSPGIAQEPELDRTSPKIQTALKPVLELVAPSIVDIESQHERRSLGTVVSSEGLVIAKLSELGDSFQCSIDGQKFASVLIGLHRGHDLALIQLKTEESKQGDAPEQPLALNPIRFVLNSPSVEPGLFVVSTASATGEAHMGIVSVSPQRFDIQQPKCDDCIDFGVTVSELPVSIAGSLSPQIKEADTPTQGLNVERVYPRTVSEKCGLLVGDSLQSINGRAVLSRSELDRTTKKLRVGQTVNLVVVRNGEVKELSTKINSLAPRMLHDRWGGGPFSEKRFGFPEVISHDSIIKPEDCGGPLTDLRGNVIGINISRSMRVATFAIPIYYVHRFVRYVRPNATLVYGQPNVNQTPNLSSPINASR